MNASPPSQELPFCINGGVLITVPTCMYSIQECIVGRYAYYYSHMYVQYTRMYSGKVCLLLFTHLCIVHKYVQWVGMLITVHTCTVYKNVQWEGMLITVLAHMNRVQECTVGRCACYSSHIYEQCTRMQSGKVCLLLFTHVCIVCKNVQWGGMLITFHICMCSAQECKDSLTLYMYLRRVLSIPPHYSFLHTIHTCVKSNKHTSPLYMLAHYTYMCGQ